jgi:hypothetical protein
VHISIFFICYVTNIIPLIQYAQRRENQLTPIALNFTIYFRIRNSMVEELYKKVFYLKYLGRTLLKACHKIFRCYSALAHRVGQHTSTLGVPPIYPLHIAPTSLLARSCRRLPARVVASLCVSSLFPVCSRCPCAKSCVYARLSCIVRACRACCLCAIRVSRAPVSRHALYAHHLSASCRIAHVIYLFIYWTNRY